MPAWHSLGNSQAFVGFLLGSARITDAGLVHLRSLTQLENLNLSAPRITDAGMAHIEGLTQLQSLNLSEASISGRGLARLAALANLKTLSLRGRGITGGEGGPIPVLPRLTDLDLENTRITDADLARIGSMPQLENLSLADTAITDAGLAYLGPLRDLKRLDLRDTAITGEGFGRLPVFRGLDTLDLGGTAVTGPGFQRLGDRGVIREVMALNMNARGGPWPNLANTHAIGGVFTGGCITLGVANFPCSGRRLAAEGDAASRAIFRQLADKDKAANAAKELLQAAGASDVLRGEEEGGIREVRASAFVRTPAGVEPLILLGPADVGRFQNREIVDASALHWIDYWAAGRLVAFGSGGKPTWVATRLSHWTAMVVADADGDDRAEELVRWNTDYEKAQGSFPRDPRSHPTGIAGDAGDHPGSGQGAKSSPLVHAPQRGWIHGRDYRAEKGGQVCSRDRLPLPSRVPHLGRGRRACHPCWRKLNNPWIEMDYEELCADPRRPTAFAGTSRKNRPGWQQGRMSRFAVSAVSWILSCTVTARQCGRFANSQPLVFVG